MSRLSCGMGMGGIWELLDGKIWEWDLSYRWEWEWDGNEVIKMEGNWHETSIPISRTSVVQGRVKTFVGQAPIFR